MSGTDLAQWDRLLFGTSLRTFLAAHGAWLYHKAGWNVITPEADAARDREIEEILKPL